MAATLASQLISVQAAIAAIESGSQSIIIEGRTYTYPDLQTLYSREERILNLIERENATTGGSRRVAEF